MDFSALALGCEAGDGPHLYLDACVELLVSHVPYTLDRGGNRFVLQIESGLECEETNGNPVAAGPLINEDSSSVTGLALVSLTSHADSPHTCTAWQILEGGRQAR